MKSKPKTKPAKPFKIAIHGPDIDIDASFVLPPSPSKKKKGSQFGDSLGGLIDMITLRMAGPSRGVSADASASAAASLADHISNLGKTVTPEQAAQFEAIATPSQLTTVMEVLKWASDTVQAHGKADAAPGKPHDFDLIQRVIEHGDSDVLRAIIDLASAKLEATESRVVQ